MPTLYWAQSPCCQGGLGTRGARHSDPTCSWPCLTPPLLQCRVPHPACTLSAWHWIHGFWQFVTPLKRHITRLLAIYLWLILVKHKENGISKISLEFFHTIFHFSNLFFLSQSYCCSAYSVVCPSSYTYIHACVSADIQTRPSETEETIFTSEMQTSGLQENAKGFSPQEGSSQHLFSGWTSVTLRFQSVLHLGPTLIARWSCP